MTNVTVTDNWTLANGYRRSWRDNGAAVAALVCLIASIVISVCGNLPLAAWWWGVAIILAAYSARPSQ